jgi:glycosyltransferase involved in cell wall biosynthesis
MIVVFCSHRTKNKTQVSPFNEIFLKKISRTNEILVLYIRNFSFYRPFILDTVYADYRVIEISCFLLPTNSDIYLLRLLNQIISKIILFVLKKKCIIKDVTLVHQIGVFAPIGYYFSELLNVKCILQLIGTDFIYFNSWRAKIHTDVIITANSKKLLDGISDLGIKSKVIYRGIDLSLFKENLDPQKFAYKKVFYGGGFPNPRKVKTRKYDYKGGLSFIDVLTKISYFSVSIAGPNCEVGKLYTDQMKGSQINFLYYLNHPEILLEISKSDIVIIPSYYEGIANIAMEAMLAGKLVISRNVGGMPELIQNKKNGFLFNTNEELLGILNSMTKLCNENKISILDELRINAKETIIKHFNNDNMIEQYNALYKQF